MIPLPEWAPNIHPLVVHFPIVLLVIAVACDAIALAFRKNPGLRTVAVGLFLLGGAAAIAAYFTGDSAADQVTVPLAAQAILTEHEDWAERTAWFFGLFALLRVGLLWFNRKGQVWAGEWTHRVVFLAGVAGIFLLFQTGDRGARMVFQYGVGVQAAEADHKHDAAQTDLPETPGPVVESVVSPVRSENGSWRWDAIVSAKTPGGPGSEFRFLIGNLEELNPVVTDSAMTLQLDGTPVLFVVDPEMGNIQADVVMNIDRFSGSVRLVHHVLDPQTYDFLEVEDGVVRQGRVNASGTKVFDEKAQTANGWFTLRAVGDKDHFRGYVDGALRVHGHGSEPEAGPVGLLFEGSGLAQIRRIEVQLLR